MKERIVLKYQLDRDGDLKCLQQSRLEKYLKNVRRRSILNVTIIPAAGDIQRSNKQNKYYWKVVIGYIADDLKWLPEEVHEAFKQKFLMDYSTPGLQRMRSTTELSTGEFEEYTERCRQFGAEFLNIQIPLPNETEY